MTLQHIGQNFNESLLKKSDENSTHLQSKNGGYEKDNIFLKTVDTNPKSRPLYNLLESLPRIT